MKLKNLIDLSPQDFIIHTKLKHAKNLLIKGLLSIKEVAYSSGFSNPKYFSTSFKKFYGQTPSGFLDGLKKWDSFLDIRFLFFYEVILSLYKTA